MGCTSSLVSFQCTYSLGNQLGEGAFGRVHASTHKFTNKECAVKILDLRQDAVTLRLNRKLAKTAEHEEALMRKVQGSVHCVKLLDAFQCECMHYMVMEKCGDTLETRLPAIPSLGCTEISRIFREMTLGIAHIHMRRIVHRDVKPSNFLFGGPVGDTLKLCDFGLAAELPKCGQLKGAIGTLPYMSPELVTDLIGYDRKTDIWSLGATMYRALFGCYPYEPKDPTKERVTRAIISGIPAPAFAPARDQLPERFPDAAVSFVRLLLERDASFRCGAEQALTLPFIRRASSKPTVPPAQEACRQRPGGGSEKVAAAPVCTVTTGIQLPLSPRSMASASTDTGSSPTISSGTSTVRTRDNWHERRAANLLRHGVICI